MEDKENKYMTDIKYKLKSNYVLSIISTKTIEMC